MEAISTRVSHKCRFCLALFAVLPIAAASGGEASASEREVIGHSVQGRPIVSIHSGAANPDVGVLVVGATHGNETAGMRIARRLTSSAASHPSTELHQILGLSAPKFDAVRKGVSLTVVPTINPDGVAAGSRGNAHGVDLNRNFPFDWRPLTGGEYSGPRSLSEPESRAAHRLILRTRPDLTIWFHQPFGLVDRPEGNAFAARRFSQLIGLPLVNLPGPYPGSASRWQNHRLPDGEAFVVELPSRVTGALVKRGVAAVLTLASELSSPALLRRVAP
jgi:murein peptide amidase A